MAELYLYGSFDRFNFGDILFPLILSKWIEQNPDLREVYNVNFISPFSGDETAKGGVQSKSFRWAYRRLKKEDALVVVGGDVLSVSWFLLYVHRFSFDLKLRILLKFQSILGNNARKAANRLIGRVYGYNASVLPYLITKRAKDFKLIVCGVGGSSLSTKEAVYFGEMVNDADIFSVRDTVTKNLLPRNNEIQTIPDVALLTNEYLINNSSRSASLLSRDDYFVFQIGRQYLHDENEHELADQLNEIIERTGLLLVLLPIGTAKGHEDHIALNKLSKSFAQDEYVLISNPTIEIICDIISKAHFFIGTSLHGAITSMSYYKPHFALNLDIKKIKAYLETWQMAPFGQPVDIGNLSKTVLEFLDAEFNQKHYNQHVDDQKKLLRAYLKECKRLLLKKANPINLVA